MTDANQPRLHDAVVRLFYMSLLGREPTQQEMDRGIIDADDMSALRRRLLGTPGLVGEMFHESFPQPHWVLTPVHNGRHMWVDLSDQFVSAGCFMNNWEYAETTFIRNHLKAGQKFLDVGANIGWFTLLGADLVGPTGKVQAFEPRPATLDHLRQTIAYNRLDDVVTIHPVALGAKEDVLELAWERGTGNPGGSALATAHHPAAQTDTYERVQVRVAALDDYLPDFTPDLIKMDIEGAEPFFVKGAQNMLRRAGCMVLSELYPQALANVAGVTALDYIRQMEELGYECRLLENAAPGRRLHDFPHESGRGMCSVVFVRP